MPVPSHAEGPSNPRPTEERPKGKHRGAPPRGERANQIAGGRLDVNVPADAWHAIKESAAEVTPAQAQAVLEKLKNPTAQSKSQPAARTQSRIRYGKPLDCASLQLDRLPRPLGARPDPIGARPSAPLDPNP